MLPGRTKVPPSPETRSRPDRRRPPSRRNSSPRSLVRAPVRCAGQTEQATSTAAAAAGKQSRAAWPLSSAARCAAARRSRGGATANSVGPCGADCAVGLKNGLCQRHSRPRPRPRRKPRRKPGRATRPRGNASCVSRQTTTLSAPPPQKGVLHCSRARTARTVRAHYGAASRGCGVSFASALVEESSGSLLHSLAAAAPALGTTLLV